MTLHHLLIESEEAELQEGSHEYPGPEQMVEGCKARAPDATDSVYSLSCLCGVDRLPRSVVWGWLIPPHSHSVLDRDAAIITIVLYGQDPGALLHQLKGKAPGAPLRRSVPRSYSLSSCIKWAPVFLLINLATLGLICNIGDLVP